MIGSNLLLLVLLGQVPAPASTPTPSALVAQLGASRYAEREEAASALERVGRDALPALRAAREARDPEVRSKAIALINKIEGTLLTQPSLIALNFQDQPLAEVVKAFGSQAGIKMALMPENAPIHEGKRITLLESSPLPFWKALDRLCDAGQLQYNSTMHGYSTMREPVFPLFAGGVRNSGPTCDHGPFRINLISVHYSRDLAFIAPPNALVNRAGRPVPMPQPLPPPLPAQAQVPRPGHTFNEQFYAQLQVAAEPRLTLTLNGPLKMREAVDDRGQSLMVSTGSGGLSRRESGYFGMSAGSTLQLQVPLRYPEQPGKKIKTLRGVLPVLVATRKPDPLIVPLSGAAGKSFQNDDVVVGVQEIRTNPQNRQMSIDLALRSGRGPTGPGGAVPDGESAHPRPDMHQQQIEVVDGQGRPIPWYQSSFDSEGSRLTLTLTPNEQGIPSALRYYGLARATTEVSFEFFDVPMMP